MTQETVLGEPEISSRAEETAGGSRNEEEVDLGRFATLVRQGRKTILRFMFAFVAVTALVVFLMKPTYTAQAVFLPPQTSPGSGIAQLASQIGSLGSGTLSGLKNPNDLYIGILGSRTIADTLIKRFDLEKVYRTKRLSDAEKRLAEVSKFVSGKNTLITISVEDHDPKRAADIANAYLDVLHEQNDRLALTEASQRRLFFEEQLEHEKNVLADAEVELKRTQERTGMIVPSGQAQVEIEAIAQIRAQIASRQVELSALRQGATDQNPSVVRLQTEILGLQAELQKMQNDPTQRQPGSVQVPTAKVPELSLEYVRKQRDVKYHETLFELLARQYETARLDESREAPVLQVIDRAVVPDRKSGPRRMLFLGIACVLGAFAGMGWVFLKQPLAK